MSRSTRTDVRYAPSLMQGQRPSNPPHATFRGTETACLRTGAYRAAVEEMRALTALHAWLELASGNLSRPMRLLVSEYCRNAMDRCWSDLTSELPVEQPSSPLHNGHLDRAVATLLADLDADWRNPDEAGHERTV